MEKESAYVTVPRHCRSLDSAKIEEVTSPCDRAGMVCIADRSSICNVNFLNT